MTTMGAEPTFPTARIERWRLPIGGVHPCAPTIDHGVVYAVGDHLRAIDLRSGRERWRVPTTTLSSDWASYYAQWVESPTRGLMSTTPAVGNGVIYAGDSFGFFYAVDATTGAIRWSDDGPGMSLVSSPLILDRGIWAGSINKRQYILSSDTGEPVWEFEGNSLVLSSALLQNETIFFADESNLYAIDQTLIGGAGDALRWEWAGEDPDSQPPTVRRDHICADGLVYSVACYPLVEAEDPEQASTPALGAGEVLLAQRMLDETPGRLLSLGVDDGRVRWETPIGLGNDPFAVTDAAAILSEGQCVVAVAIHNGRELWRTEVGVASSPLVVDDTIIVGVRTNSGGALVALGVNDGVERWRHPVPEVEGLGAPTAGDGLIVVGSINLGRDDNLLFAFAIPTAAR